MIKVNTDQCIGCGQCVKDCFPRDIELINGKAVVNNITCINCGHCIAVCPENAVSTDEYSMEDVKEYDKETFEIDDEHLLNFIKFRRTIRQFKNKDVENEMLKKIIEAGRYTQTGRNLQDVSYIVIKEGMQEFKALVLSSLKGLGTFFSGFTVRAAIDNPKISEFLGLPKDKKLVTCMVIGHPNVKYFRSVPRKKAEISWK